MQEGALPEAHVTLAEYLEQKEGIDKKQTLELLVLVEANEELRALVEIALNLEKILPLLTCIDPDKWAVDQVGVWVCICKQIFIHRYELSKRVQGIWRETNETKTPIAGFITRFPLYTSFWREMATHDCQAVLLLQAHFINCCSAYRELEKGGKKYGSIKAQASLMIRRIRQEDDDGDDFVLSLLPLTPLDVNAFRRLAEKQLINLPSDEKEKRSFEVIERMLAYAQKLRGGHVRVGLRKISARVIKQKQDPESDIEISFKQVITSSNVEGGEEKEAHNLGCYRGEVFNGSQVAIISDGFGKNEGGTAIQQVLRAKSYSRYLATNNQQLPQSWERLSLHDVVQIFKSIEKMLARKFMRELDLGQELAALIGIVYWTSSPLKKALEARVCRSVDDLPKNIKPEQVFYCMRENVWGVGAPNLEQRKLGDAEWQAYLEQSQSILILRMPLSAFKSMKPWLNRRSRGILSKSRPIFGGKTERILDQLNTFIKAVNKTQYTRLTAHRISMHLFQVLSDRCADTADASMITGREPPHGQGAALYYYAPKVSYLEGAYYEAAKAIADTVKAPLGWSDDETVNNKVFSDDRSVERVGSKICPLDETVRLMVDDFKEEVNSLRVSRSSNEWFIDFHNSFTSYCVMLLGFCSGYRAVRDPFYSEAEIDWESNFIVITDKDSDDFYNSRIVWVPDLCMDQIREYSRHRNALLDKLVLQNTKLADVIKAQRGTHGWPRKTKEKVDNLPFFFYLRASKVGGKDDLGQGVDHARGNLIQNIKVGPAELSKKIGWSYLLPINSNRHYLRTRLREKGVAGEMVDAFMGHWERGQEPFGCYSTLSPLAFVESLSTPMSDILNGAGWCVLKGF